MTTTKIRPIKVTNTLTGKKEPLETLRPGKLTMYSCGPTVYNFVHIGNLRGGLVSDLFFRYFKRVGYDVTYVRNYTDVDDKIIQRGHDEGIPPQEVARKYTMEVEKDFAVAGMQEPTHKTTVTTHMPEIIALVERLVANGKAYVIDTGEVLFSIADFPGYGKLSHKNIDELQAGARVEVNSKKRNPLDFSLWKPAKAGEPYWESPWGRGRPGWHIECSAMAGKWLGDRIDVHHGGEDLVFPHHENEIAQSEGASGQAPFVRHWLHHAFLTMSKEKMSKSLGNVFTARQFLAQYGGEVARYMLLSVHYRSMIDFGEETIDQALTSLQRIYEAKATAVRLAQKKTAMPDLRAENLWGSFVADCDRTRREIDEHLANDFNTAGALASLFSLIREFNRILAEPKATATPAAVLGAQQLIQVMEDDIGSVIGVARQDPDKLLAELAAIRAARPAAGGAARPSEQEILDAIQARADARKARDFARADAIRKDLEARGVEIKDGPQGTTWMYR
jgi:cysteinyl-tRNA synthetase